MGILWALAGPGTVPGAGSVVVLGLNSRAVSTKETEYIGVSCDVVTSLLRREKQGTELEKGKLELEGRVLERSGAET